ncbi:MAG: 2-phospho-L-lactate guanylyltransferase [Myxococcales bacterium]|jgi:2-phospho-L-lactate guanylyltransferase
MNRWALVPIKGFDRGKSRLAEVLSPAERVRLTRGMFEHVVSVLRASPAIDQVAVVSDSADARELANRLGLVALVDAEGSQGLADVVDGALVDLEKRGATSVMICMSDLPDLSVADIERVSRQLERSDVVLVPDLSRRGTNVVAVRPATRLPSCLGHEDSLRRHQDQARSLGLSVSIQVSDGIGFDLDQPDDLERLRGR